ncbi:hypothetical protein N9X40_03455, partial [bacterium]|nr:hypothetical protein [bacterium]
GAARSLQNAAEALEERFDKPVAGVYSAMGRDGNFFNQAFADALQQQVDAKDLPQEAIDHFDNSIRTLHGKKDWVGLRHPDARKQLLGKDGYPQKGAGNLRSAYVMQMDKAAYKNQGFPLLQPLMNELIEPELANVNVGDSGFIMGQIGKDFGLSPNANHPSYTTGIMGREIGGTPVSLPSRIMYPDAYKILDQSLTKAGEKYTASQMINALAVRHDMYQIATPEWVDSASEWIRKNPKGTANALLMAVGTPIALGSSEETEAAIIPKLSQEIARIKRAEALGYNMSPEARLYHASKQDINQFEAGYDDGLIFTTPDPEFANKWLGKGRFAERQGGTGAIEGIKAEKKRFRTEQNEIMKDMTEEQRAKYFHETVMPQQQQLIMDERLADNAIYPLVTKAKKPFIPDQDVGVLEELYGKEYMAAPFGSGFPTYKDALKDGNYLLYENKQVVDFLKSKGYDSMFIKESAGTESPYTTLALFDAKDLKSPHAQFKDPNNRNILAGAGALGLMSLFAPEEAEAAPSMLKSIALDAMSEVTRKTPTSYTGWKKALNKAGVKDDELKQMGFKQEFEYRQRSQDITRKEVEDFLAAKQYNIREETLGQRKEFGEVDFDPELNTYNAVMPDNLDDAMFHTRAEAEAYIARNPTTINDAQYAPYTLTGGDNVNYREILLLDGVEADKYEGLTKQITKLENEIAKGIGKPEGYLARDAIVDLDEGSEFYEPYKRLTELRKERNDLAQPFIHRHYDDKENILTHLRVADRDLEDGSSTLMVEEIQSDLHQRGQEVGYAKAQDLKGVEDQLEQVNQAISGLKVSAVRGWAEENTPDLYNRTYGGEPNQEEFTALRQQMRDAFNQDYKARTGKDVDAEFDRLADIRDRLKAKQLSTMKAAPDMPFKSNDKSSWYDLAFKRSLIEAAEGDYDSISFSTGKQQVNRYGESAEGGVKTFYDKTLPNHINKWAKQYGVKLERKPIKVGEYEYSVDSYDDGTYYVRNDEGTTIEDFDSYSDALEYVRVNTDIDDVYTLKIPEKMRDDIRKKGMPLFAQTGLTIGGATAASGLLSPKAQANEARTKGLMQNIASRKDIAERAGAVPDLTAGLLEQTGRDIINFGAGVINPDYGDIAEGGMFPVTEKGEAALTKAGEVFMDKVAPTLVKVGRGLLDDQPMFGGTLREQLGMVRDQYNKLPEGVREEVTPRLGYAGLLALTLSPAAQPVKKAIKKRKKTKQE